MVLNHIKEGKIAMSENEVASSPAVGHVLELLGYMTALTMLAKDCHYAASGRAFWSEHRFADFVGDAACLCDELIEVFFLGARGIRPPSMASIHARGVAIASPGVNSFGAEASPSADALFAKMLDCALMCINAVEECKKEIPCAGVNAVLDEISKRMLLISGFVRRTLLLLS